jgi:hypothetical protein
VIDTAGATPRVTVIEAGALALPAKSVAVAVIVFEPSATGTTALQLVPVSVAGTPFTTTLATPLVASVAVPVTVRLDAVVSDPFAGAAIETLGATMSTVTVTSSR